jgi:hypothetical protein
MNDKKTYVTTKAAGFVVAGRRIPSTYELDEEQTPRAKPNVGFRMELTDAEAEYELAQGTIALAPIEAAPAAEEKKSPEPDAGDAA